MTGRDMKDSIFPLLSREPKDHGLTLFLILLCSGIFLPGPLAHADRCGAGMENRTEEGILW
jgi:hypothetical protein